MNREVLKVKMESEKLTSQEKKWLRLLDGTKMHPREDVIKRWVDRPHTFDLEEQDSMRKHYNVCMNCEKKRDNVRPLLDDMEKAS